MKSQSSSENIAANVKKALPFFAVSDGVTIIGGSLRYCVDGLGFEMKNKWSPTANCAGAGWTVAARR